MNDQLQIPHALAVEEAVMGLILSEPIPYLEKAKKAGINKASFFSPGLAGLLNHLNERCERGQGCDVVSVLDSLDTAGKLESLGGRAGVLGISGNPSLPSQWASHVELLHEHSRRRFVIDKALRLAREASDGEGDNLHEHVEELSMGLKHHASTRQDLGTFVGEALMTSAGLIKAKIPERETIVGPFMKEADTGFIYAPRGLGKTWMATGLAKIIAMGGKLGDWQSSKPRKVMIIDGEMNLDASQERLSLMGADCDNLEILHHEQIYASSDGEVSLNLALPSHQHEIKELIKKRKSRVVILDNLSCLFRGVNENEADAWEAVAPWLLDLRRAGVSVIIVAHAGRNGNMRGTSRREDAAHWILSLEESKDDDGEFSGAKFKSRFTKCRNSTPEKTPPLVWEFESLEGGGVNVTSKSMSDLDSMWDLIDNGLDSATDIAKELDRPKGTISKWARKLVALDRITIENGKYHPVRKMNS